MDLSQDILQPLYKEIKEPIELLIEKRYGSAAVILIFAGIDAVANLGRPKDAALNNPDDFKQWISKYLKIAGAESVSGDDWWSARNAALHTSSPYSKDTESKKAKYLLFAFESEKSLAETRPKLGVLSKNHVPDAVGVSIHALASAFFKGIDEFLIKSFADVNFRPLFEERISRMFRAMSMSQLHEKYQAIEQK